MSKSIIISESAKGKVKGKELFNLTNMVKSKSGKVGQSGELKHNVFYKIIKSGFILF